MGALSLQGAVEFFAGNAPVGTIITLGCSRNDILSVLLDITVTQKPDHNTDLTPAPLTECIAFRHTLFQLLNCLLVGIPSFWVVVRVLSAGDGQWVAVIKIQSIHHLQAVRRQQQQVRQSGGYKEQTNGTTSSIVVAITGPRQRQRKIWHVLTPNTVPRQQSLGLGVLY